MMVCTGTSLQRYSPALGPLPRPTVVSLSERLTCTGGPFATGAADAAFANPASCLVPPVTGTVPPADVLTYRWSNGQTSTITYTLTTVARAANQNIVTSAGTVPFGYAQGSVAQREVIMPNLDVLGCLASNISQQSGSETLSILL
ncbi:hypothetical protein [Kitasatospora sp. SolWspMP-SS2h]|uniref:hypothetical protein n=1 Tax=Kitasatospora sp. SolWspMP-SS2h TaxID=1305729 RepID=UPI000DB9AFB3|nr:hypothetical protein [Kitasatospora sp. SolWspMP-SS2h]